MRWKLLGTIADPLVLDLVGDFFICAFIRGVVEEVERLGFSRALEFRLLLLTLKPSCSIPAMYVGPAIF